MPRWNITPQIFLSFYLFQKFQMYKDLEENEELYLQCPAIHELCGKKADTIPEEILNEPLDLLLIRPTHSMFWMLMHHNSAH